MALNLSRNTKVFVSSVNGVVANSNASRGGVKSITTLAGTSSGTYAVGDVLTLQGATNSDEMKVIVKTVSGSDVESVYIPNNFRGNNFTDGENLSQTATTGTATGFTAVVDGVSANGKTVDGSRNGLGVFKGNESNANTFKIGVLDGYSFSQASENTDITVSEAGATPNRTSRRFNDSLAPAEWSFQTYARPFVHGTNSFRDTGQIDMVENILWAALAGQSITKAEDDADTSQGGAAGETTNGAVKFTSSTADVNFVSSDAHELLKLNIFFALENTTYRLNECQVNQVEIDFSIDGIATLSWSGNATTIDQVSEIIEDPSKVLSTDGTTDTGNTDGTFAEKYNYVDVTGSADADYLKNKLSQLSLSTAAQGGGAGSGGLDSKTYSVNITGGSITIANNITYLTPETLGIVDKPIGSFTGARNVTGSLTCYLDTKSNGSNQLLTDLSAATGLIQPQFNMSLFMGGDTTAFASRTSPVIELDIPRAMLSIPTVEVADIISTTVEFAALPAETLSSSDATTYDMQVKYHGETSFSESGYDTTSDASNLYNSDGSA
jgi:hypothetical protein